MEKFSEIRHKYGDADENKDMLLTLNVEISRQNILKLEYKSIKSRSNGNSTSHRSAARDGSAGSVLVDHGLKSCAWQRHRLQLGVPAFHNACHCFNSYRQ